MPDLIYLFVVVVFFVIAVGFVRVCDRIIGPDGESSRMATPSASPGVEPTDPIDPAAVAVSAR